jgi:transposase-like protein
MRALRSRKSEPHRCPGCGSSFEVTYLDDRRGERALLPMASLDVACPLCGRTRSVTLPAGAERTLEVEPVEGPEADEGGGG